MPLAASARRPEKQRGKRAARLALRAAIAAQDFHRLAVPQILEKPSAILLQVLQCVDPRPISNTTDATKFATTAEDTAMKTNTVEALRLSEIGEAGRTIGGRVIHDVRGNAKWDWAVSTAVLAKKSVAELMNTLDVPALTVDGGLATEERTGDPYNRCGRRA